MGSGIAGQYRRVRLLVTCRELNYLIMEDFLSFVADCARKAVCSMSALPDGTSGEDCDQNEFLF